MWKKAIGDFTLALGLLVASDSGFAGRATAPYVKGEVLVALREGTGTTAPPVRLTSGERIPLSRLKNTGVLREKAATLLSKAGAMGLTGVMRQRASDLQPGRSPNDWHQVYRISFRTASPLFRDHASLMQFCEELSALPEVEYAEPNYVGSLCAVPNDPLYPIHQQAMFTQYGLETAWDVETGSPEMIIAVIDSGIDLDHPDLMNNLAVNSGEVPGNHLDDDGNGYVDDVHGWNCLEGSGDVEDAMDHGTRVAGIIAAQANNAIGIAGVCWQASLLPVRVSSATGGITVDRVAAAIKYAVARGAKVINLSLVFSGESLTLKAACNGAAQSAVLVAAAGNNGQNYVPLYPAGFEGVVGVAALDGTGQRAAFSNYNHPEVNEWVDFAAPGTEMFTTFPLGLYDGDLGRGTSFAAPFVSGIAALLQAAHPWQSPEAIRDHLQRTADTSIDFTTYGIIDAAAALTIPMEADLRIASVRVIEIASSDEDQTLDAGETAEVYLEIENLGADMLEAKNAALFSLGAPITVTPARSTSTLPALKSGESSRQFLAPYEVEAISPTSQVDVAMQLDVDGIDTLSFALRVEEEAPVPQWVASNRTLDPNHTWIVSGITTVATGATLTIQPGATLRFDEEARLEVWGRLSSVGTQEGPIHWVNRTPPPQSLFAHSREYPVGEWPTSVALGDADGDGVMDLVTANTLSNDVSVLSGDGAGGFLPQVRYPVGEWPTSVALSDVNGDGVADLIATNEMSDDASVLLGDGAGGVLAEVRYFVGDGPINVAVDDADGDGIPDIVTANSNSSDVSVLAGDGAGGFSPQVRYSVGALPLGVALGDVNGDEIPDIVTANAGTDDVSVLSGNGSGGFLAEVRYAVGNWPAGVALGDVDGDAIPDIVTANSGTDDVSVLSGNGSGGFFPQVRYSVGDEPSGVAIGDMDGDAIPDIVTANLMSKDVSVLSGDGSGGFLPQVRYPLGVLPSGVTLGDVDGDGVADIVAGNELGAEVSVLLGGGSGGFSPRVRYPVGEWPMSVALSDVDGDGGTDIVTANQSGNDVSVLSGDGSGGFLPQARYPVGDEPGGVALGDLNGDRVLDIVATNALSEDVSVLLGDGSGKFLPQVRYAAGEGARGPAIGDADGDGVPDIVTANEWGDDISVLPGNGSGGFLPQVRYAVGEGPSNVALGDVNGDTVPDMVTVNWYSDDMSVLLGNGSGGFLPQALYPVGEMPNGVTLGDVDQDGALDIVLANFGSSDVSVFLGDGSGGLLPQKRYPAGAFPMGLALGDVDGDGAPDIVMPRPVSDDVSVLLGDGLGGFLPPVRYPVGPWPSSVALDDLDRDRCLDIVAANFFGDNVSVLSGDGTGSFRGGRPSLISHTNQVTLTHSVFQLPSGLLLLDGGNITDCKFQDSGAPGLAAQGNLLISDCTADNCLSIGFYLRGTSSSAQGLVSVDNRGSGIWAHSASACLTRGNFGWGIAANATVTNCLADLNQEQGLFALDIVKDCISTRNAGNGIQGRIVENSVAGSNSLVGIVASELVTGCTAIGNGQGVQAPRVEDTFILESYGDGLVGVDNAYGIELQDNYSISTDEVRFGTSILANNGSEADLVQVKGMYLAGNAGGGVDGIPVIDSTIVGNDGPGVMNSISVTSSNIAFNQGVGVIGGTVDGSFLRGNQGADTQGAVVTNPQSAPVQSAPAFLCDVTPDESLPLGIAFHRFSFHFSKPMSTSVIPVITHGPSPPYTARVFQNATWLSPEVLRARTYIDFDTGQGWQTIRLSGAVAADGFRIPPDTYHRFRVDLEAGLVISSGRVVQVSSDALHITWEPSAQVDVESYYVYRSFSMNGPWGPAPVAILNVPDHEYIDSPLPTGIQCFYRVIEKDALGGFTELTNPISGTTQEMPTPQVTPTSTPTPKRPDFTDDGHVDASDLLEMMKAFGTSEPEDRIDLNGDGKHDYKDLFLFSRWWITSPLTQIPRP